MTNPTPPSRTGPLAIWRARAKANPCTHCGAKTGEPCRADAGDGPELKHFVHPIRAAEKTPPKETA